MITSAEELLLDVVKSALLGVKVPSNLHGKAGNHIETLLRKLGFPINSRGLIDIKKRGIKLEVKSRRNDASSAFTIGSMLKSKIIKTSDWYQSPMCKKMNKILLFTTGGTELNPDDNIILDISIYDFKDRPEIQDLLKDSWDNSRQQLITNAKNKNFKYCSSDGYIAYFERVPDKNSWQFRFNKTRYQSLLRMEKSNFKNIFEYGV
jgi:hypothetical protein